MNFIREDGNKNEVTKHCFFNCKEEAVFKNHVTLISLIATSKGNADCACGFCGFTKSQCVVQVGEQKFVWHSSEALGKEKHVQTKAFRGARESKPSTAVFWVRPLPDLSSMSPGLQYFNRTRIQTAYHLGNTVLAF